MEGVAAPAVEVRDLVAEQQMLRPIDRSMHRRGNVFFSPLLLVLLGVHVKGLTNIFLAGSKMPYSITCLHVYICGFFREKASAEPERRLEPSPALN